MNAPPTSTRRKAARPTGPPRLFLTIRDHLYVIRRVACDPGIAGRAFRLLKEDGTLYDVVQTEHGPTCDCPDFIFRRDGLDPEGCKHVRALVDCGLIERQQVRQSS
jgi:hypothetical protein